MEAEPGVDEAALEELERGGWQVVRWQERNLYFGGVQAVARDPATGELTGGGDPRRGGVAVIVRLRPRPAAGRLRRTDSVQSRAAALGQPATLVGRAGRRGRSRPPGRWPSRPAHHPPPAPPSRAWPSPGAAGTRARGRPPSAPGHVGTRRRGRPRDVDGRALGCAPLPGRRRGLRPGSERSSRRPCRRRSRRRPCRGSRAEAEARVASGRAEVVDRRPSRPRMPAAV